jgi:hypothetical protein
MHIPTGYSAHLNPQGQGHYSLLYRKQTFCFVRFVVFMAVTMKNAISSYASSSIVHKRRLRTVTASVPTTIATIYSQSAQATSNYQQSEDFSGNQPDPLSGFIRLH